MRNDRQHRERPNGLDRAGQLIGVRKRFEDEQVHSAFFKRGGLLAKRLAQLVV
jgi:hypothetical protein